MSNCPCGLQGDDCQELVSPLASVDLAIQCNVETTVVCEVSREAATCVCDCGFGGELCSVPLVASADNFVVGTIIVVLVVFVSVIAAYQFERLRTDNIDRLKQNFVRSHLKCVSPQIILLYRCLAFTIYVIFALYILLKSPQDMVTLTIWSWHLIGVQFLVGVCLSIRNLLQPVEPSARAGRLEYVYSIIEDITLPISLFVALAFWLFLPFVSDPDQLDDFTQPIQVVYHGLNFVILFIEFMMHKCYFVPLSVFYKLIYASLYILFHQFLMFYYEINDQPVCAVYFLLDMSVEEYPVAVIATLTVASLNFFLIYLASEIKKKLLKNIWDGKDLVDFDSATYN